MPVPDPLPDNACPQVLLYLVHEFVCDRDGAVGVKKRIGVTGDPSVISTGSEGLQGCCDSRIIHSLRDLHLEEAADPRVE